MSIIAESELILNSRGAVYHLNLLPEELAHTIITVGDPERVPAVSRYFDKIEVKSGHREFQTHTGTLGKERISVISSGIGTDNIDIVLNELDALANINLATRTLKPDFTKLTIIRLGTSGSLQEDIPVDSLVASTHGLGIDNLLHFYRHTQTDEENLLLQAFLSTISLQSQHISPYISKASTSLLHQLASGLPSGITVSCPGFYGPQGRILRLGLSTPEMVNRFSQFGFGPHRITNFEMETSAIYGLGKLLGHQCLSINAIVANRISQTFTPNAPLLIDRLIRHCLENLSGSS